MNVHLKLQRRTLGNGRKAIYYLLQWHDEASKLRTQSLGRVTKGQAEDLRRAKIAELLGAPLGAGAPRSTMTLGVFLPAYLEARTQPEQTGARHIHFPRLKASTLREHDVAVRYLIEHLGEHRGLDTIGETEVETFLDALAGVEARESLGDGAGDARGR